MIETFCIHFVRTCAQHSKDRLWKGQKSPFFLSNSMLKDLFKFFKFPPTADEWQVNYFFCACFSKDRSDLYLFFLFYSLSGNPEILSWKMVWDPEGNNGWWQLITVKLYASRSNEFFFCTLKKAIEMSRKSQAFFENSFWELVINNVDF